MNDCKINVVISAAANRTAASENRLNLVVRTGDDMGSHQSITHPLAGIGSRSDGCVDSTCFTANHHSDVTTTHIFTTDQGHLGGFGHGIGRFNGGHHSTGLDHAEGNPQGMISNGS